MKTLFTALVALLLTAPPALAQRFPRIANTLQDMVASNPNVVHTNVFVADINRGGMFFWLAGSTLATNAGTVYPSIYPGVVGRYLREVTGPLDVRWFGATVGDATDDSAAGQATIDLASTSTNSNEVLFRPGGTGGYIMGNLIARSNVRISGAAYVNIPVAATNFLSISNVVNVEVRDLTIYANSTNHTAFWLANDAHEINFHKVFVTGTPIWSGRATWAGNGPYAWVIQRSYINEWESCSAEFMGTEVWFNSDNAHRNTFLGCSFKNANLYNVLATINGAQVNSTGHDNTFFGCDIEGPSTFVRLTAAEVNFTSCYFEGPSTAVRQIEIDGDSIVTIANSYMWDTYVGFGSTSGVAAGLTLRENVWDGIGSSTTSPFIRYTSDSSAPLILEHNKAKAAVVIYRSGQWWDGAIWQDLTNNEEEIRDSNLFYDPAALVNRRAYSSGPFLDSQRFNHPLGVNRYPDNALGLALKVTANPTNAANMSLLAWENAYVSAGHFFSGIDKSNRLSFVWYPSTNNTIFALDSDGYAALPNFGAETNRLLFLGPAPYNRILPVTNLVNLTFDGTTLTATGGGGATNAGTTINPTDGFIPYRLDSLTFSNSPLQRVSATELESTASLRLTNTTRLFLPNGTEALPSLTFQATQDAGLFRDASAGVGITVGGNDQLRVAINELTINTNTVIGFSGDPGTLSPDVTWRIGSGTPEGVVSANKGSWFMRRDGDTNTMAYIKSSGSGTTGWTPLTTGATSGSSTNSLERGIFVGSGTDYALTTTPLVVTFGGGMAEIVLPTAGAIYQIAATWPVQDTMAMAQSFVLTNITDGRIVLGATNTYIPSGDYTRVGFIGQYTNVNANSQLQLWGSTLNGSATNANVQATNTVLSYIDLSTGAGGSGGIADGSVTDAKLNLSTPAIGAASAISLTSSSVTTDLVTYDRAACEPFDLGTIANGGTATLDIGHSCFRVATSGESWTLSVTTNTLDGIYVVSGTSSYSLGGQVCTLSNAAIRPERSATVPSSTFTVSQGTSAKFTVALVVVGGVIERYSVTGDDFTPATPASVVTVNSITGISATDTQGALEEMALEKADISALAAVAFDGAYSSLAGTPVIIPATGFSARASGTAYSLTATPAALDFGTSDPVLPLTSAGTYLLFASAKLDYNATTFSANRTVTLRVRRTNNTPAYVDDSPQTLLTDVQGSAITTLFDEVTFKVIGYTTTNTDDSLTLFGDISVVPGAGSLDVTAASITALRISSFTSVDASAPSLVSATIAADGVTLTTVWSESVTFGAGGNGGFAITPSGGAATLAYSSGAGSATLIHIINRTIILGETATLAYTQPGNGLEDASGNDKTTFSGTSITNNSSQSGFTAATAVFDGSNDYIRLEASPTGMADAKTVTGSFLVKFNGGDGTAQALVSVANTTTTRFSVTRTAANVIQIIGKTSGGATMLDVSTTNTITNADGWVHVYFCFDTTDAAKRKIYFDGVSQTLTVTTYDATTNIDLLPASPRYTFGATSQAASKANVALAELWFNNAYLDDTTKFASGGSPISLGATGNTPTGTAPVFYFSLNGSGNAWATESAHANVFTVTGSLGSTTPP